MSKPTYLQDVSKIKFLDDTRLLVKHTITKCTNENTFAKRYRWCITSKIVDSALELYSNVRRANSVYVKTAKDYELRRAYQKRAIAEVDALLGLIDIAYQQFPKFTGDELEYWVKLAKNCLNSLKNWTDSEAEKYKGL